MNDIQVITNDQFSSIRITVIDKKPWFVARDIAFALGYTNPRQAIADHVNSDDRDIAKCDTTGGPQNLVIINEAGLYSLVLSSKLPSAKHFQTWITRDVLPTLRQLCIGFSDDVLLHILAAHT